MKPITKTLILLCVISALLAFPATATSNELLPSEEDTHKIISDANTKDPSELFNYVKDNKIATNCDLLKCSTCLGSKYATVLYFKDATSSKGYGGLYFKDGEIVAPSSLKWYETDDSYKGEDRSEDNKAVNESETCSIKHADNGEKSTGDNESNESKSIWSWFSKGDDETSNNSTNTEYKYTVVNNSTGNYPEDYLNAEPDELTNRDKVKSVMHYYESGNMTAGSLEKCLYFYFVKEDE